MSLLLFVPKALDCLSRKQTTAHAKEGIRQRHIQQLRRKHGCYRCVMKSVQVFRYSNILMLSLFYQYCANVDNYFLMRKFKYKNNSQIQGNRKVYEDVYVLGKERLAVTSRFIRLCTIVTKLLY